ncbi:SNF1- protein kinase regulatory subunit beta-2 [Ancistrocladus abbreviatus]
MGNVNGREDGSRSPSGVEEDGSFGAVGGGVTAQDGLVYAVGGSPELMGQSPPHSPRAIHSPLMFTPQVPVVPLQKPDEIHIPNPSWMHSTSQYEDMSFEQGIPTMITWSYGGKDVAVEGSWDDWKTRKPLQRSGKDFTIMKVLPSGVYRYRFIVDGQWRYAPEIPWAQDEAGNYYNVLDLQEYVPDHLESVSGFEPPQSPDSSYNSMQLNSEDFAKEPPLVPPHLQMTLLNAPSPCMEIPPPISRPQHVVLNHLYMQKGKSSPSVVALGSTHRFLSKYVTVVLYKSL